MAKDRMSRQPGDEVPGRWPSDLNPRKLRVCFVLAYRAPDYVRGRSIIEALQRLEDVDLILAVNRHKGVGRYLDMLLQLVRTRKATDPDLYILGFRGHEAAWLVRWLTRGKPLVFDAMMSPYAALSTEGKAGWIGRMLAPLWRGYEKAILHGADMVLTDTALHAAYYAHEFDLATADILPLPVGAIERPVPAEAPRQAAADDTFRVLFYGSFLPLHGVDCILHAAMQLTDLPIEFRFVGGTAAQGRKLRKACDAAGIRRYSHARWIPLERLLCDEIPRADLCLGGPFGGTPQARRVVTGKSLQCLALARATVIGRIDEDCGFLDRVNCLLVDQADATALANAIRWGYANRDKLPSIGRQGQLLYARRFSIDVIASRLMPALLNLVTKHAT